MQKIRANLCSTALFFPSINHLTTSPDLSCDPLEKTAELNYLTVYKVIKKVAPARLATTMKGYLQIDTLV